MLSHLRYLYRFYHSRATRTWSVCNEMYHNVFRYEYLTFQTQINLHKQYIFDTDITQSEYAFLFPFSIVQMVERRNNDLKIAGQCWFEPTVRHYFSFDNFRLLAYVCTGEDPQFE